MEQKPNVMPTKEQIEAANAASDVKKAQEPINNTNTAPDVEIEFAKQMELEAQQQVEAIKRGEKIIRHDLADTTNQKIVATGSNYKQESIEKPRPQIERARIEPKPTQSNIDLPNRPQQTKPINVPYDVIPLPSEGKIYKHKKTHLKIAYLNASDENILSSPNILESGEFLDILINRKILDEGIELKDLHIGDRNAIMVWLRATGYGEMYPIVVYDDDDNPFDAEIDLSTLPYIKLGAEPDSEGLISFKLEKTKKNIKFRMLNVGDIDEIDKLTKYELGELELPYANTVTNRLERMIVEIDGIRDKEALKQFITVMPAADSRALRNYYNDIESNIDLKIKVEVPGGGLIETFLPININFFWPDFRI